MSTLDNLHFQFASAVNDGCMVNCKIQFVRCTRTLNKWEFQQNVTVNIHMLNFFLINYYLCGMFRINNNTLWFPNWQLCTSSTNLGTCFCVNPVDSLFYLLDYVTFKRLFTQKTYSYIKSWSRYQCLPNI